MKREPRHSIAPERQAIYYGGMVVMGIGVLMFLSTFVIFIANFGNFDHFTERARTSGMLAFGGMGLMVVGAILQGIGKQGLAGSGIVLDPKQAREDLEPWNRMAGGMTNDALQEVDLVRKLEDRLDATPEAAPAAVKVRCPACRELNDEDAKFCKKCGNAM